MHILLTNDDGPPHPSFSPYISTLVSVLTSPPFNHTVSVVVPSQQRSWIGKAHLLPASTYQEPKNPVPQPHGESQDSAASNGAGGEGLVYGNTSKNEQIDDNVKPTYLDPETGKIYMHPSYIPSRSSPTTSPTHWTLVPGTPATCTQLGLFHYSTLFPSSSSSSSSPPPIDLVLSGPNHGRNTSAAFALSSGTLGGALEAAVAGYRAIALSFAFFTRQESAELVREACVLSAKVIDKLVDGWSGLEDAERVEVYSINVPLVEGIGGKEVKWTWMLDNKWGGGTGLYALTALPSAQSDGDGESAGPVPPTFKWAPSFTNIWQTINESADGNDGKTVRDGFASVTPLRANFEGVYGKGRFTGNLKL